MSVNRRNWRRSLKANNCPLAEVEARLGEDGLICMIALGPEMFAPNEQKQLSSLDSFIDRMRSTFYGKHLRIVDQFGDYKKPVIGRFRINSISVNGVDIGDPGIDVDIKGIEVKGVDVELPPLRAGDRVDIEVKNGNTPKLLNVIIIGTREIRLDPTEHEQNE
jgi:hypothetical protein